MLKTIIRKIDDVLLAKTLQNYYGRYMTAKTQSAFQSDLNYKIVSLYHKNNDWYSPNFVDTLHNAI